MNIVPQTVTLIDSMGSDLSVVNAARVSFHKESDWERTSEEGPTEYHPPEPEKGFDGATIKTVIHRIKGLNEKDARLIGYLAKHGHWTPFAHAFLSFRIKAPIFVARQLVKHQVGLAWNEVSRRYVDDEPEFWFPEYLQGRPDNSIKQGTSGEAHEDSNEWLKVGRESTEKALKAYLGMIAEGVAPEEARIFLPLNSMTEWIWSGSLAAFARVCKLRLAPHGVQKATKEVAQLINDQVPKTFEHSWKALLA